MGIELMAECGINHNGNIVMAKEMIKTAKLCGADVAKFQIYDPEKILDKNHPDIKPYWDTILKAQLTDNQVYLLKEECDRVGIEFLASVFSPKAVELTESIGMKRYKIASRSIYNKKLAEAIVDTGKPVIISYGMVESGKLPAIVELEGGMASRFSHLYCVSEYPTPIEHVNFLTDTGVSIFGPMGYDGFSDHTVGMLASAVAMFFGAKIIEKHFTLDRDLDGPDHECSVEPIELQMLGMMKNA